MKDPIPDLMNFLKNSPTSWQAVSEAQSRLESQGFIALDERKSWKLKTGQSYYVTRGNLLTAWVMPEKELRTARLMASHLDSPGFKLKPHAEIRRDKAILLGVEIYGSPLITSWLNRDLGIAGRVFFQGKKGVESSLVTLDRAPVTFAQLAIHLDRTANENGPEVQKQEQLLVLASPHDEKDLWLERQIQQIIGPHPILSHDLFLYPLEEPRRLGARGELLSAYRIDSLSSVHAGLTALLKTHQSPSPYLRLITFWDHEEVGSTSAQGASSTFLLEILERICLTLNMNREDWFRLLRETMCFSVDLGHALHPAYPNKHDAQHRPLLNQGIVIKSNAQQRYATDSAGAAEVIALCNRKKIPYQLFASRNDIPSGTTIGPILASASGIKTVDIGIPQLSMHSCREILGCEDQISMIRLLEAWLA